MAWSKIAIPHLFVFLGEKWCVESLKLQLSQLTHSHHDLLKNLLRTSMVQLLRARVIDFFASTIWHKYHKLTIRVKPSSFNTQVTSAEGPWPCLGFAKAAHWVFDISLSDSENYIESKDFRSFSLWKSFPPLQWSLVELPRTSFTGISQFGGVHSHGGTPIAGWFLLGKIPSRNGW